MNNEPVAWHYPNGKPDQCTTNQAYAEKTPAWTPMYYKHKWVDLTNEELTDLFYNKNLGQQSAVAQAIALLKEKNK
jgi:hypothetical protein